MRILLVFIDGIGTGPDDPTVNPFSVAAMPTLHALTNGHRWVQGIGHQQSNNALFFPVDPRMGVDGRPQSGSNHATIITGKPIPQLIGEHYGPKPNAATRAIVDEGSFFSEVIERGLSADLLTAYPPHLLHNIKRGKTLPSAFMQAAMNAGRPLHTVEDLRAGRALSADWTGAGWRDHLNIDDVPQLSHHEGGVRMAQLAQQHTFAMHTHTFTDFVGHRGTLDDAVTLLQNLDTVMAGVLDTWDAENDLLILTSDHGNMERIGSRTHTQNDVPLLLVGAGRHTIAQHVKTLADLVPAMRQLLF
jgi:2,3-bisphosphoglycerate-independent phosphoglycerate mutase